MAIDRSTVRSRVTAAHQSTTRPYAHIAPLADVVARAAATIAVPTSPTASLTTPLVTVGRRLPRPVVTPAPAPLRVAAAATAATAAAVISVAVGSRPGVDQTFIALHQARRLFMERGVGRWVQQREQQWRSLRLPKHERGFIMHLVRYLVHAAVLLRKTFRSSYIKYTEPCSLMVYHASVECKARKVMVFV